MTIFYDAKNHSSYFNIYPSDSILVLNLLEGKGNSQYNTLQLQNAINTYPKGQKKFYFKAGTYYFDPVDLNSINTDILDINLIGETTGSDEYSYNGTLVTIYTNKKDFLHVSKDNPPSCTFNVQDISFSAYDGYSEIPSGVCFGCSTNTTSGNECNFHFYNVSIHGFDYGFISTAYSCGASGGRRISFDTCHYGIYIGAASHLFHIEDLDLTYNRVGVRLSHGGTPCLIRNVHVATGYLGADKDDFDEFIVIHTKGNTVIEGLYQEAYESTAQPYKTIVFDFEGWAFGCGHMIIKNVPIAKPDASGGKWLRCRGYLGAGPETGIENPNPIKGRCFGHYPEGKVELINCKADFFRHKLDDLLKLIEVQDSICIFGLILGFDIYNGSKILFGKKGYEMDVHIKSNMGNISYTTKKDDNYIYKIIESSSWRDVQNDSGLTYGGYDNQGLFNIQKETIINGNFIVDENNIPEGINIEFGACYYSYGSSQVVNFKPICTLTKSTLPGFVIPVNESFLPCNITNMQFPSTVSFGYRLLASSSIDITSYNIKLSMNLNFKSI